MVKALKILSVGHTTNKSHQSFLVVMETYSVTITKGFSLAHLKLLHSCWFSHTVLHSCIKILAHGETSSRLDSIMTVTWTADSGDSDLDSPPPMPHHPFAFPSSLPPHTSNLLRNFHKRNGSLCLLNWVSVMMKLSGFAVVIFSGGKHK